MHINHSSLINKDILNNFKEGKDTGVIQHPIKIIPTVAALIVVACHHNFIKALK